MGAKRNTRTARLGLVLPRFSSGVRAGALAHRLSLTAAVLATGLLTLAVPATGAWAQDDATVSTEAPAETQPEAQSEAQSDTQPDAATDDASADGSADASDTGAETDTEAAASSTASAAAPAAEAVAPMGTNVGAPILGNSDAGWLHNLFFRRIGASDAALDSEALFMMIFAFCAFFFVLLMVLMVIFVIKYRRRPGVPAPVSPSHNTPLEIAWTIVPSSGLLVIFLLGYWGYMQHVVASGPQPVQLEVKGWRWGWEVIQPNGVTSNSAQTLSVENAPVFLVPEQTPIVFRMSSSDVIHSFWIPDLRVKFDVFPNRYTGYTFTTMTLNEDEQYRDLWIFCAEYCGTKHSEMAAVLRVVRRPAYAQWLVDANTEGLSPVELGKTVWQSKCAVCHSLDGARGTGPTWKGGMESDTFGYGYGYPVEFADGTRLESRDSNYLREAILVPGASIVRGYANQMPPFAGQLSDAQLDGLIALMQSVSDRGPALDADEAGAAGETGSESEAGAEGEAGEAEGAGAADEPDLPPADAAAPDVQAGQPPAESGGG